MGLVEEGLKSKSRLPTLAEKELGVGGRRTVRNGGLEGVAWERLHSKNQGGAGTIQQPEGDQEKKIAILEPHQ